MEGQLIATWAGVGLTILGTIIGLIKYFGGEIESVRKEGDAKTARVYERFDEYKQNVESKFVFKDLCTMSHQNSSANIEKLEQRVDKGFTELNNKMDKFLNVLIEKQ